MRAPWWLIAISPALIGLAVCVGAVIGTLLVKLLERLVSWRCSRRAR